MSKLLIDKLSEAWSGGPALSAEQARALAPRNHAEAYAIQRGVGKALGWFGEAGPEFWKLGGPRGSSTAAPVPKSLIKRLAADQQVQLVDDDACQFTALEVELAVRLGEPLLPGSTLEEACAAIDAVYLAIEVCDLRASDLEQVPNTFRLADQQVNRGFLLLDNPVEGWRSDFEQITPLIKRNDDVLSHSTLTHPQGHPLTALPWLANLSAALYQAPLATGTLIATGAWAGMHMLKTGDQFHAHLDNFTPFSASLETATSTSAPVRFTNGYLKKA